MPEIKRYKVTLVSGKHSTFTVKHDEDGRRTKTTRFYEAGESWYVDPSQIQGYLGNVQFRVEPEYTPPRKPKGKKGKKGKK